MEGGIGKNIKERPLEYHSIPSQSKQSKLEGYRVWSNK